MFIEDMNAWKQKLIALGLTESRYQPSFSVELSVSTDRDGDDTFGEIAAFVDRVRSLCSILGIDPNMLENLRYPETSDHEVVTRYVSFLPQVKEGKRAYHEKYGIVLVDSIDWSEGGICVVALSGSGTQVNCIYHSLEGREF